MTDEGTVELNDVWKWLLGAVLVILFAVFGVAYAGVELRLKGLEAERMAQTEAHRLIAKDLATITANQNNVMQGLRDNGIKLDTLIQRVYTK